MKLISSLVVLVSILTLAEQATLKSLNKQCLCDITDQCDTQCCCDSACNNSLISQWKNYKMCLDDGFGIPFCSKLQQTDLNVLDLHSGLRTIYSVIKRLLCINSVNFVQTSDWFKKSARQKDLDNQISLLSTVQSQSVVNPYVLGQAQFPIAGLPLKGSNGLCRTSLQITKNHQKSSSCRVYVKDSTVLSQNQILSVAKLISALSSPSIKIFDSKTSTTGAVTSQSLVTSCTVGNVCQNVVRKINILINTNTGAIDPNSYIVVGPLIVDQAAYINIDYEYTFIKIQNNQIVFPLSSKVGYQFGSKLNLLNRDTSSAQAQYFKIFSPINLAFKKLDGTCRTALTDPLSNQTANSFVELEFGKNQVISCLGTSNIIQENIRTAFNFVGKYGASSTKLSEYVSVSFPSGTVSGSQSVQLVFYYINIGVPENPQYEISKVQIKPVIIKDGLSTLYVEFISVGNSFDLYVPPAPIVDAYLPNDFLYPFFVA